MRHSINYFYIQLDKKKKVDSLPRYLSESVSFFVMPKGIWVEEGFMAKGAHQPHAQVHSPDVGADSGTWGGWALFATFHLALIHPFGTPQLYSKGLHVCTGMSSPVAGVAATGAGMVAGPTGSKVSGCVGSWGGWEWTKGLGLMWGWEGRGLDGRGWKDEVTPLRSPYRPSASDPVMASLNFPHPSASILSASASNFRASSLLLLASWSNLNPCKEGGKECITTKDSIDYEGNWWQTSW